MPSSAASASRNVPTATNYNYMRILLFFGFQFILIQSTITDESSSTVSNSNDNDNDENNELPSFSSIKTCFSYGCPFHPSDIIHSDTTTSLTKLLSAKEDDPSVKSTVEGDDVAVLTLTGFKGHGKEQINQDRAFVVSPFRLHLDDENNENPVVLLDGHGYRGEEVSEYTLHELPRRLSLSPSSDIPSLLKDIFIQIDATIPTNGVGGCTASIILKTLDNKVYVANAGDSRSFLALYDSHADIIEVIYASREDKPDLTEERERVERMGGTVYIPQKKGGTSRVIAGQTGLAMSRSIGDWAHGKLGVIPDPIVDIVDIEDLRKQKLQTPCFNKNDSQQQSDTDDDDHDNRVCDNTMNSTAPQWHLFAISATDGMLDILPPDVIATHVARSLYKSDTPHVLMACDELIRESARGWGN